MPPLELYIPTMAELGFYQRVLQDPQSMSYNAPWFPPDGCISFPESAWEEWYQQWFNQSPDRFFAYLRRSIDTLNVGYVHYRRNHSLNRWEMGIVIDYKERGRGYGRAGLSLLLYQAFVIDKIPALHNTFERSRDAAYQLHLSLGFWETTADEEYCHLLLTREAYLKDNALDY